MSEVQRFLTPWAVDNFPGSAGENVFRIQLDYPSYELILDDTQTPSENVPNDPDQLVVEWVGDPAVLDQIEADPLYTSMLGTRQVYNPPAVIDIIAADLGDNVAGVTATQGVASTLRYRDTTIARIASTPALGSIIAFDLALSFPVPQDIFHSIQINGTTVLSQDAVFDADDQTWAWFGANFNFIPGARHRIIIRGADPAELDEIPGQSEYVQWRNAIAQERDPVTDKRYWTNAQLIQAIGTGVDGRSRRQLNADMTNFLQSSPAAA